MSARVSRALRFAVPLAVASTGVGAWRAFGRGGHANVHGAQRHAPLHSARELPSTSEPSDPCARPAANVVMFSEGRPAEWVGLARIDEEHRIQAQLLRHGTPGDAVRAPKQGEGGATEAGMLQSAQATDAEWQSVVEMLDRGFHDNRSDHETPGLDGTMFLLRFRVNGRERESCLLPSLAVLELNLELGKVISAHGGTKAREPKTCVPAPCDMRWPEEGLEQNWCGAGRTEVRRNRSCVGRLGVGRRVVVAVRADGASQFVFDGSGQYFLEYELDSLWPDRLPRLSCDESAWQSARCSR